MKENMRITLDDEQMKIVCKNINVAAQVEAILLKLDCYFHSVHKDNPQFIIREQDSILYQLLIALSNGNIEL